ncbi:DNA internalization-related competence protein ComEC/Rec2 [Heyndrickxia camelliae]|uniref:DNA internalization-related competence protein ComEC/Rec2 n=1 Tax=Heyndrickxia camelliae TaxID=1707093 RepID=A0A2N3LKG9_9BACI|nr:DNA internalization-related competence protein ComEC/Rec2 [Heyndrickxia camelliae]PKR85132.1 DNA internalization-related competence protein ComEC/Rec2 [Heyndrickxia camelliae]
MQGYWFYLSMAALSATSLALHVHYGLSIIFHLFCLQSILTKKRKLIIFTLLTYILFFVISFYSNQSHKKTNFSILQTEFHIIFQNMPIIDGNKVSSIVQTDKKEHVALSYIIASEAEKKHLERQFKTGISCNVTGTLSKPEKNKNRNLFNYKQYLFRQNVHWKLKVTQFKNCRDNGKGIVYKLKRVRESALKEIELQYPPELIPYAKALLFGDRVDFEEDAYSLFQRLGIVHLLAISGLHVSLIYLGFYYFLIRIGVTRENSSWIIICFLPIYAILCGANPPVIRATIMLIIILLSTHSRLSLTSIDGLAISFLLFLMKDPFIIFNVGFQLSFIVSLSILLSSRTVIARYKNNIVQLMVISFISQISSLPIIMYQFYQISIISILSNLFFVPLYSFVLLPLLILSFFTLFLIPMVFRLIVNVLLVIISASEWFAEFLDFKWSVLIVGRPGIWVLIVILLAVLFLFYNWEKGKKIHVSAYPLCIVISLYMISKWFNPYGEVAFIDIGQGDSILIQLPYNRGTYLIDTGGSMAFEVPEWSKRKRQFSVGKDILVPYLKGKGISKIDKLILTHSDADHIGAAKELVGTIKITEAYISPDSWRKPLMYETLFHFQKEKIAIMEVKDGFGWKTKESSFLMVYPFDRQYEGNNDSLVLLAKIGGRSWLFTGDLEQEGEEELVRSHRIQADVLKVGHHGSKTSTSLKFLESIDPKIAVISAGEDNRYGHPNEEVLERLKHEKIKVFRTDLEGEVIYKFTGNNGTFETVFP